ncbi:MAG TPA: hypothetical protein VKA70_00375 [Blastocatellia bacterium]|nr:hypothetical protein [Blastocatellia bacterium]
MQGSHTITVAPWGPDQQAIDAAKARVMSNATVQKYLRGTRNRILSFDYIENNSKESGRSEPPTRFRAMVFDYTNNRTVIAEGGFYDSAMAVTLSDLQPEPGPEEFDAAVAVVAADPEFGPALSSKRLELYPPMPPLSTDPSVKGKPERTVTVGLFPTDDKYSHQIVGVNMVKRTVVRYAQGAPPSSKAATLNCGVINQSQATTTNNTAGQVEIVISRDGVEFWRFICVRPSASSGARKSGIELRDVRYMGKMVLARASTPILNVQYERNVCGPFRDWMWQEGMFEAPGTDVAPGIRMCTSEPTTVIESGADWGTYRGVAIWDREEVRLVSELEASWYRYITEWRFHDDGVIQPMMGYGAVSNSCVCNIHTHHAYWRFDFDLGTAADNNFYESKDGERHHTQVETKLVRDGSIQSYVVENSVTGESVIIEPGPRDGNMDKFGAGDLWILLSHFPLELDDALFRTTAQVALDPMLTGESLINQDVVVWYAAHWRHDHFEGPVPGGPNHGVGPNVHGPTLRLQKY